MVHLFAPEVTAMKVSCLVTESEGVAPLCINLFKKLKMTPEIRSPRPLMIPRAQTTLYLNVGGARFSSPSFYWFDGLEALLCYSLNNSSTPCKH